MSECITNHPVLSRANFILGHTAHFSSLSNKKSQKLAILEQYTLPVHLKKRTSIKPKQVSEKPKSVVIGPPVRINVRRLGPSINPIHEVNKKRGSSKKLDLMRIEVLTKYKILTDFQKRYHDLDIVRNQLKQTKQKLAMEQNSRISDILHSINQQETTLCELKRQTIPIEPTDHHQPTNRLIALRNKADRLAKILAQRSALLISVTEFQRTQELNPAFHQLELDQLTSKLATISTQSKHDHANHTSQVNQLIQDSQNAMMSHLKECYDVDHNQKLNEYMNTYTIPIFQSQTRLKHDIQMQLNEQQSIQQKVNELRLQKIMIAK